MAITTAGGVIDAALREIGVLMEDEAPSATQNALALDVLNLMIDDLNGEGVSLFSIKDETFTSTASTTYTIGSGGTWNTKWPTRIHAARSTVSGVVYPIQIIDAAENARLASQNATFSTPSYLWCDFAYPLATVTLYGAMAGTVTLTLEQQLTEFASTSTSLSFPPAYRGLLVYGLAVRLAARWGVDPKQAVVSMAASSKATVRRLARTRQAVIVSDDISTLLGARSAFNALTGA